MTSGPRRETAHGLCKIYPAAASWGWTTRDTTYCGEGHATANQVFGVHNDNGGRDFPDVVPFLRHTKSTVPMSVPAYWFNLRKDARRDGRGGCDVFRERVAVR